VAVASDGPNANHLQLISHSEAHQQLVIHFLQARCYCWCL